MDELNITKYVSDIAKSINEHANPQNGKITAIKINQLLIQAGDLTDTAIGKVETKLGRKHGISGTYRQTEDNGAYWQPLYNAQATAYVLNLVYKAYPKLVPSKKKPKDIVKDDINKELEANLAEAELSTQQDPQQHDYRTCAFCMEYRCGDCWGHSEICTDFRFTGYISDEEKANWPTMGDASSLLFKGHTGD